MSSDFVPDENPPEARRYLHEERGFTDETVTRFRIGYANGGLRQYVIEERGFTLELCLKSGVLKKRDDGQVNDFFYKRLIFPNLRRGHMLRNKADVVPG